MRQGRIPQAPIRPVADPISDNDLRAQHILSPLQAALILAQAQRVEAVVACAASIDRCEQARTLPSAEFLPITEREEPFLLTDYYVVQMSGYVKECSDANLLWSVISSSRCSMLYAVSRSPLQYPTGQRALQVSRSGQARQPGGASAGSGANRAASGRGAAAHGNLAAGSGQHF